MTSTDDVLYARRRDRAAKLYFDVFGAGILDTADVILAPDAVSHGPGVPPVVGTAGIKRQAGVLRTAFPDFRVDLLQQVAEGDRVVSHWRGRGTHTGSLNLPSPPLPPSGTAIEFTEMRIDRFEGDRIVESWFLPDRFTLWQQLGLIGPP